MANVLFIKVATGYSFGPGQKANWVWNNAPSNTVYSFSVQPYVLVGSSGQAEVTRVSYSIQGNPQERKVNIEVTNTGNTTINYDLFMSQISA